jgi:tripartite-type tricarboxylate transporter receptor subunit TctC
MTLIARLVTSMATAMLVASAFSQPTFPVPGKPIRLVLPVGAGNAVDVRARQLAQKLGDALAVPIVVENRPGASGMLAAQEAAKGAPDGHTLFFGNIQTHVLNDFLLPDAQALRIDDLFRPVTMTNRAAIMLVVHKDVPASSPKELFDLIRAQPGRLNFGTGGVGSSSHLFGELLKGRLNLDMLAVHYKATGADMIDLAGGQLQVGGQYFSSVMPYVQAGKVRVLAVAGPRRTPALPDVPTLAEAGFAGLDLHGWSGVFVPAGTPDAVIHQLQRSIHHVLHTREVLDSYAQAGGEVGGEPPEQFAAYIRAERERWGKLIAERGIKPQ